MTPTDALSQQPFKVIQCFANTALSAAFDSVALTSQKEDLACCWSSSSQVLPQRDAIIQLHLYPDIRECPHQMHESSKMQGNFAALYSIYTFIVA